MALFGSAKKSATEEFTQVVWPVLTYHKEVGIKQKKFLTDPFVYGYLWGAWKGFSEAPPCAQLSDRQKASIMLAIDEMIQPSWPGIFGIIQLVVSPMPSKKYAKEENPDWRRGIVNGSRYTRWLYGVGNIAHDPDILDAIETAKALNISIVGQSEVVVKDPTHEQVAENLFRNSFEMVVMDRFAKPAT